jgi:general secretion pathway protein L
MVGLAEDAPSLIAPLERSGYFGQVRFAAPSTRGTDGSRFRFHIEGRVVPRLDIPEN